MAVISTDMRETKEIARRLHFEATATIAANNVQTAIELAAGGGDPIIPTTVLAGMSPYTPLATDRILLVDTSVAPVTISLSLAAARLGNDLVIKDATGNAATNNITINRGGAELIDGLTSIVIDSPFSTYRLAPKTGGYILD